MKRGRRFLSLLLRRRGKEDVSWPRGRRVDWLPIEKRNDLLEMDAKGETNTRETRKQAEKERKRDSG